MQTAESVEVVRCPTCKGLRGVAARHLTRQDRICPDCRRGKVILRSQYHNYWLKRFTQEEIEEMGRAIWG